MVGFNVRQAFDVESVHTRRILRPRLVEADDPPRQGVRTVGRGAAQGLQEAQYPQPAARLVGEKGSRQTGEADTASIVERWRRGRDHDCERRASAGAGTDRNGPRECARPCVDDRVRERADRQSDR